MSERNRYNVEIWCDCTMGCKKCGRENTLPIIDVQKLIDENQALLKENKRLREALCAISNSSCPMRENEYGYTSETPECHEIAEKALEGKS